jgi:phosphate transport system permease protein
MLPERISLPLARWKFGFILLVLPVGFLGAVGLGPILEAVFFGGNLRAWLDGRAGSSVGGWFLLLFPLSAIICAFLMGRLVNPWLRQISITWSGRSTGRLDAVKFLAGIAFTVLIALSAAQLLDVVGLDARGSLMGPYSQRNALIVGFVMGFAIIPIIYTLAEDALSSVPEHLRAGSLAAGATRWQTAVRIVIPTAMSGLFSAVMIGMGRAVGETMIVLMAAGNTPVIDWSIFTGFRTLSANIATELPEAVQDSTHYRTLFLAALTLFAITFVLNTVAEMVRLRFRRRAYQL